MATDKTPEPGKKPEPVADTFESLRLLDKDLKKAAALMSRDEARFLVDDYYMIQDYRIRSAAQQRSMEGEPTACFAWMFDNTRRLEANLKRALQQFADRWNVGIWCQKVVGIGPVITAGLLTHFDIRRAPTVGHFWSFAGLLPNVRWEKGQRRPFNLTLKTLCAFKAGESFVKVQNKKNDIYGKVYAERKAKEIEINEAGGFAELAAEKLDTVKKTTQAYKHFLEGRLPPGHLHNRARRYAVKLFISHLHYVMFLEYWGQEPPVPYSLSEHCPQEHRHYIDPPYLPMPTEGDTLRDLLGPPLPKGNIERKPADDDQE